MSAERDAIASTADDGLGAKIAAAIEQIEAGGARVPGWKLKRDSWKLIEPGLDRGYREGRKSLRRARKERNPDSVHEFRKRAKDLWYELRLLAGCWPDLLEETAAQAHQLSELLGDHHDLAVLAEDLGERVGVLADQDAIGALIERRQEELFEQALGLGERLYVEKPKHYRRRLRAYWRIWQGE